MPPLKKSWLVLGIVFVVLTGGVVGWVWYGQLYSDSSKSNAEDNPLPKVDRDGRLLVKTIIPKRDSTLSLSITQFATVEAFYSTELRSRVAGVVKSVSKNIGETVKAGELLVEIEVPDLDKEVAQKRSLVEQRLQELEAAKLQIKTAEARRDVVIAVVRQNEAQLKQAEATCNFRKSRLERFESLAKREAISQDIVDEQRYEYLSALATLDAARLAIQKAEAELRERELNIESCQADVLLKKALVDVAQKDLERVEALASYARVTAPFDGTITSRHVDPGSFVQDASRGQTDYLLKLTRTDLVTVVTRIPDNAASLVTRNTKALVEIFQLPGIVIEGEVSRFSPMIQPEDRTMRVEVDVLNGSELDYKKVGDPAMKSLYAAAARVKMLGPIQADPPKLLPGMTGTINLRIGGPSELLVIPSEAIYSRGGKQYILEVRAGKTHQVPVRVEINDGTIAKVATVERNGSVEVLRELTGAEEIVLSRQLEIGDGQPVRTTKVDW
jgi:multidrug resistance efflux pump